MWIFLKSFSNRACIGQGFLCENGPYLINGSTLVDNLHTWNTKFNVVFVDQPAGTGYSYCPTDECYVTSLDQMADQMFDFLTGFLKLHPEFENSQLYLTGESFAGKYLPFIADRILKDQSASTLKQKLSGLMIGNPEIDTLLQYPLTATYLRNLGLIGTSEEQAAIEDFENCSQLVSSGHWLAATHECERWLDALVATAGNPFRYDIRKYSDWTLTKIEEMGKYLNSGKFRAVQM